MEDGSDLIQDPVKKYINLYDEVHALLLVVFLVLDFLEMFSTF